MNIFPDLKGKRWVHIDLNAESLKTSLDLSNSEICKRWIDEIHKKKGVEHSYGGFLEDRSNLWKDHYNKEINAFVHLGVDFSVPARTKVALVRRARVESILIDKDQHGGWGGMIVWKLLDEDYYLSYGHLKHEIKLKVGDIKEAGEIFAEVGESDENGGWWPHLHLQLMDQGFIDAFGGDWGEIDGYLSKGSKLIKNVFNPMRLVEF
ncbi:MAG: peptidoglycan DD-metalloendopeptidase family protein [Nanoarchaeota archaeon]|nr:peptidoglycan DD-metalloendopeptidase family protein [Nanoarchaeota archaeon]